MLYFSYNNKNVAKITYFDKNTVHKNIGEKMFAKYVPVYGCFVKTILSTNTSRRKAGKQQLEIILRVYKKVLLKEEILPDY